MIRHTGIVFALMLLSASFSAAERPNVLFIAVDDLRPQLACYGKTTMQTPNIDALANRGVLFERAYCMVPTCGASRASLFTSIRPAPQRFVTHLAWAEKDAPGVLPLHTHFKNNGYTTISLGKILHQINDHADGWSEPAWRSKKSGYQNVDDMRDAIAENKRRWPRKSKHRGPAFEASDSDDQDHPDGDCVNRAVEYLETFARSPDQPFFLAVGLTKPHLPFNAPQKYFDLYDFDSIDVPDNYSLPSDLPPRAVHNSGELRAYAGIHPSDPLDRESARKLIHGYYACVSFADANVGMLLRSLDRLELADSTIVVLWGDHGWQLGEHGMWNKHSCFETSMHAPLIVAAPGQSDVKPGTRTDALTEFIDIYPSLCDLAGLPTPGHVQGTSFLPLMKDSTLPGKPYAIGRFGTGDTIRTDRLRYSEYFDKNKFVGSMLYDHTTDPSEDHDIRSQRPKKSAELSEMLREHKGK
ncbi:sulfatase [Stieleria mannarensis]|uniref:sulfatase n=1 Tax=Stieleria mannarensis TaxID=2755585 RepID=UPI001602F362|nr:sulfatase [Rhodopirellula sp. JC639]